jgi:hypothetical protein
MQLLILKLGATGDVVRTTTLLSKFPGPITWVTADKNVGLFAGMTHHVRCFSWEERMLATDTRYDLVVNLEDTLEVAEFLGATSYKQLFGAYLDGDKRLRYTRDSRDWFDLSLISEYGKEKADKLKFENRRTYQDLIFSGLGFPFQGEKYLLPDPVETDLGGDVALSLQAGPVWPMKNWAFYSELKEKLERHGLTVNVLPKRGTLVEHMSDVCHHRCLVSGDSLPMHFALGTGTKCVSLFTCTSPWEICDYGLQKQIVSPFLKEYFFKRGFEKSATTAISVDEVFSAVVAQLANGSLSTAAAS